MTRRRLLWSAVAVVFGVLALLVVLETRLPPGLKDKAAALLVGMTVGEVEAIFGPGRPCGPVAAHHAHDKRGR
jgi:hypothetical protein